MCAVRDQFFESNQRPQPGGVIDSRSTPKMTIELLVVFALKRVRLLAKVGARGEHLL